MLLSELSTANFLLSLKSSERVPWPSSERATREAERLMEANEQWNNNYRPSRRRRLFHRLSCLVRRIFPRRRRRRVAPGLVDRSDVSFCRCCDDDRRVCRLCRPRHCRLDESTYPLAMAESAMSLDSLDGMGRSSSKYARLQKVALRRATSAPNTCLAHTQFERACASRADGRTGEDASGSDRLDKNKNANNRRRDHRHGGGRRLRLARRASNRSEDVELDDLFGTDTNMETHPLVGGSRTSPPNSCSLPRVSTARNRLPLHDATWPVSASRFSAARRTGGRDGCHAGQQATLPNYEICETQPESYGTPASERHRLHGHGSRAGHVLTTTVDTCYVPYVHNRSRSPPPPYPSNYVDSKTLP
ncbi:hypothetical protein LSAT2_009570, partial [Lamellibrachia satsuma]